jgi:predicted transposase YdaD
MAFDNLCKLLAEKHPARFASWVLGQPIESAFVLGTTRHEYQVLCMWEQDPSTFLEDVALLPLATLAAAQFPEQLLNQVAQRVSTIESTQQCRESSAYVQLLAGLRFNQSLIRQVFREGIMRESVIYQEILQEGEQTGEKRGILIGEQAVILRQLARRVGEVSPELQSQIQALSLYQLEALADALLDFSSLADLRTWLQTNQG